MELLQPKTVFLRLNLEQSTHVIDGLVENASNIEESSLPLYNSQVKDIISQLNEQGIDIVFEEAEAQTESEVNEDFVKATQLMREIRKWVYDLSIDPNELRLLNEKLTELNTVLFGE